MMSVGRPLASTAAVPPTPTPKRIRDAVNNATDLLPIQGILENFIHHNPLHHFENRQFNDALELTRTLESVASPGERVNQLVSIDPRRRSNEALVDLCAVFLDRGAAKWTPSFRNRGFLWFFASLECLGVAPWRSHARDVARHVLNASPHPGELDSVALAEQIVRENLEFFGVDESEWTDVTRVMMLELRGWAGMFHRMETHPAEQPTDTCVRLIEFCAVQSVLMRSSIEALARQHGWSETNESFAEWLSAAPKTRTAEESEHSGQHTSAIASLDQSSSRRETLEAEFQNALLTAIGTKPVAARGAGERAMLQLYTCIDDRECSFRRHIEEFNPTAIETFGVAGFFGIPLRFEPSDGGDISVLAPEGATPVAVLHEVGDGADHARYRERRRLLARCSAVWEAASFSPLGSLALSLFAPLSLTRLWMIGSAPQLYHRAIDFARAKFTPKPKTDFALPESREHAAGLLARMFNDVGHRHFAPIVLMVGHGSHSVNNPFAAAYNCGACGGREGGPNARLVARLANDHEVRALLQRTHNIVIPEDTVFVGGQHNTTAETVEFFDTDRLPPSHRALFDEVRHVVDTALGKNAMERTTRFVLASNVHTEQGALMHVNTRAADAAEVRPELNHATNAAVVIGRRELTKGRFLDRRVFLPTYDPAGDDDAGTNLEHVLAPALIVCSGINLEYLFSTIETEHHGAGSKVPLNIVGNIGVLQGTSGDLRPGLPTQMTEMHVPVRALFVIDAPIARVEAVLSRRRELQQLVHNAWVRLAVRDPTTNQFHVFSDGQYVPVGIDRNRLSTYVPLTHHRLHGMRVARNEQLIFWAASAAMMMSCIGPVLLYAGDMMNSRGALIALAGTMLSLPVLSFARRYLHGEFMFGRFSLLSVGLTLGFNLVATAPTLLQALAGWSLFGFASTFLIGAYNDRPTVRNNATFAFAAYELSDFAFLCGIAFAGFHASFGGTEHHNLACRRSAVGGAAQVESVSARRIVCTIDGGPDAGERARLRRPLGARRRRAADEHDADLVHLGLGACGSGERRVADGGVRVADRAHPSRPQGRAGERDLGDARPDFRDTCVGSRRLGVADVARACGVSHRAGAARAKRHRRLAQHPQRAGLRAMAACGAQCTVSSSVGTEAHQERHSLDAHARHDREHSGAPHSAATEQVATVGHHIGGCRIGRFAIHTVGARERGALDSFAQHGASGGDVGRVFAIGRIGDFDSILVCQCVECTSISQAQQHKRPDEARQRKRQFWKSVATLKKRKKFFFFQN
jgi:uncharacterized protein YbcC (UPF0753/DUF2309 family)